MAIRNSDGSIILTTKIDDSGIKSGMKSLTATVGKSFLAITALAATAAVSITKMAVSAYADYEQLVGGVETLFKGSAQKVIDYANDAFYTAGVSANEYMRQVTSFSASLISSTAGDTERAADIANMALIDISDNANKMGSTMESVTLAYQGFAKQQYQLLDNLKLGYEGTKGEMERLLKDAQALTGVKYDINNLSDVYSAIHAIQEELGIAETTAQEAEKTITGSANMMKAAWGNVLAAIAGGGDLDRAINNLVYSITKYFENIVPVVQRSLIGIGKLIEQVAPALVQNVASALIQAIPSLISAVFQMIVGLAKGIYQGIKALFTGGSGSVTAQIKTSVGGISSALSGAGSGMSDLGKATEKTGKQAKKSLAAFDDLNILASQESSGGGASPEMPTPSVGGGGMGTIEVPTIDVSTAQTTADSFTSIITGAFEEVRLKAIEYGDLFQPTVDAWKTAFESVKQPVADAATSIGTTSQTFLTDTLQPFATYVAEDFTPAVTNSFSQNIAPIVADTMSWAATQMAADFEWGASQVDQAVTDIIQPSMELVKDITVDTTDTIGKEWQENGDELMQGMTETSDTTKGIWESLYDSTLKPIWDKVITGVGELWNNHLAPLWGNVVDFFTSVADNVMTVWNNFLGPLVSWLIEFFGPSVSNTFSTIWDVISDVFGLISDVIGGILKALSGLLDFLTGVFSGDWEKAWTGIKKFFGGIWDAIWGIVKGVINLIIDGVNGLWRGVYNVVKGIVDAIGGVAGALGKIFGQNWSFKMPANPPVIPRLATGAVLPPNKPFMAIVGDQKHGTNIEAPADLIKQMAKEAIAESGHNGQPMREEHYYLNETQLMSVVYKLVKGGERLNGNSLLGGAY